jgi:hypothetical protein
METMTTHDDFGFRDHLSLDQAALRYRIFRDLWAVRTRRIQRAASPPASPELHRFIAGEGE